MKINWNNKYATIAMYAFLVICGSILLYLGIARFTEIKSGINDFIGTLQPFIIGTALAYLLNFILKFYEKNILSYKWFNNLNKTAKRAAVIHLSFNVLGAAIYGVIMTIFFGIFPDLAMQHISSTQISIFHSIFNVSVTILLFPFANALVKLSGIIIHEDVVEDEEEEEPEEKALRHLDPRILETPAFAVENAVKEVVRMGEIVLKNLNRVTKEAMRGEEPRQSKIDKVHNDEQVINHLEPMITEYLVKISHLAITEKEMKVVNNLFDSITDIERSGDHVENMAGYLQHIKDMKESISEDAAYELRNMNNLVKSAFESAIRAIEFDDTKEAKETLSYAADVYYTRKTIRKRHIQRMKDGECSPDVGVYFLDIISSMERIAGYAFTIARYILSQNDEEE